MKNLLFIAILYSVSNSIWAINFRAKAPAVSSQIYTDGLTLTDSQVTLSCRFHHENGQNRMNRIRYALTHHEQIGEHEYSMKIKKISLTEWLPKFDLYNCSYKLIAIAKDKNGKIYLGDLIFHGSEKEEMNANEIIQFKKDLLKVDQTLSKLSIFIESRNGKNKLQFKRH